MEMADINLTDLAHEGESKLAGRGYQSWKSILETWLARMITHELQHPVCLMHIPLVVVIASSTMYTLVVVVVCIRARMYAYTI